MTLETLGTRVLALTAVVRDLQQLFTAMELRLGGLETRIGAIEARFTALEARFAVQEARMTHMLALLLHVAERIGGSPSSMTPPRRTDENRAGSIVAPPD
jgi:hypothetical protein